MTRGSLRRLLLRLALVLVGFFLALVVGEVSLRTLGYSGEQERLETVIDSKYGTLRKGSWALNFAIDPGTQRTVTIRQQTFPLQKDPEKTRILFIGDSGTEGARVGIDDAFPARFKQLLDVQHPNNGVEVINAGVWGMTTIDEYYFLKDKLLALQPDIVVLGLFMANDINLNLGQQEKQIRFAPARRMLTLVRQNSALAHFVYLRFMMINNRHRLFESLVPLELRLVDSKGFNMMSYPVGETATYLKEPSALIDRAFEVLDRVLADFVELGRMNGFAFRVLIIPSPSAVAGELTLMHFRHDTFQFLENTGVRITPDELDFSSPTRRVLEICRRRAIVCIDPTESMRSVGLHVFFSDDEHTTPLGHDVLARELVAHLELIR